MKLKQIKALKACVYLQARMDWVEKRQNWLRTDHTGWKRHFKAFFLSKWNAECVMLPAGFLAFVGTMMTELFLPHGLAVSLGFAALTFGLCAAIMPVEKTLALGRRGRWSLKPISCEISVLEAMMAVFQERHPDLAEPFIAQFVRLKNNGLNIYQAGKIASILSHDLKISKDDAIVHLLNLTSVIPVEQNEQSILMEPQVSSAPFLRL